MGIFDAMIGKKSNDQSPTFSVELPLGCLSTTYLGIRRPEEKRHRPSSGFLDVALSPWRAGPWAMRSPSWSWLHDEIAHRVMASGSAGGVILFGDDFSIENTLSSFKKTSDKMYLEIDLTRAMERWSVSALTGAEPGYIGHSPEGSEFSKKLAVIVSLMLEWKGGHLAHRPCPVVVFKNLHRASPEVQQIVEKLATSGELPLPSGNNIKCECLLVVGTCPGIYPRWDEPSSAVRFMESTVHPNGQRLLLDPSVAETFFPMVFPPPVIGGFVSAASMHIGRLWSRSLPSGTLVHHRIVAGPILTERVLTSASLDREDTRLSKMVEKIDRSARQLLPTIPLSELPHSLVVPSRWCIMVEEEQGKLWAEACPVEEIAEQSLRINVPAPVAESLGISVPASLSWRNPFASRLMEELVIGQSSTTTDIVEKIDLFAATPDRHRALFSGLLLGPTGTGKTFLAKTLADVYGRHLIKIDCSTLQDESMLQEAIFGFGPESLSSQLALHRASVVLLDEIDKAHRSVWFLLMQALDEGVMKSSLGRDDVRLGKSVVLATSNQLAEELGSNASQFGALPRQDVDAALRQVLKNCETINEACVERFDAIYFLAPLRGDCAVQLWARVLREEFGLSAHPETVSMLMNQHGDVLGSSGARAVKRACAEITTRAHEWGMKIEDGVLLPTSGTPPMSRRQKLWLEASEKSTNFQEASTHPWAAELIQDMFIVNAGKTSPKSPQASILLIGPPGSGKTYLPQELSRRLGKGEALMVDCGTSSSLEESTSHLFGEPGVRRGYLTESLLHQPDRVVIFDEIDKAPSGLLDQLLSLLDQGRVVDRYAGQPVDMKQAAFFFTSNSLSSEMQELCELVGDPTPDPDIPRLPPASACATAAKLLEDRAVMRPEQISRLDLVVPFGLPTESGIIDHSARVIEGILEEYGLPASLVSQLAEAMPKNLIRSLDSRAIKREASRLASDLARRQRKGLDNNTSMEETLQSFDQHEEAQGKFACATLGT